MERRDFLKGSLFFTGSIFIFKQINPVWKPSPTIVTPEGSKFYYYDYTKNHNQTDIMNWSLNKHRKILPSRLPYITDDVFLESGVIDWKLGEPQINCKSITINNWDSLNIPDNFKAGDLK